MALVNSVNPDRLQGQKTAAFEIVDELGDAPDVHCLPVGNAGNITAYWMGYTEYHQDGLATRSPRMFGFQASGAAPIVRRAGAAAADDRHRDPHRQPGVLAAGRGGQGRVGRRHRVGHRPGVVAAYRLLATQEAVFGELASSASVAACSRPARAARSGRIRVVCTITGNGLKDPDWALSGAPAPATIPIDASAAATALGLT